MNIASNICIPVIETGGYMVDYRTDPKQFAQWNDRMLEGNSPETYLFNSRKLVAWIESQRVRQVMHMLCADASHRTLEVACGTGHVLCQVTSAERHGVDISRRMLARARTVVPDGKFVRGNAEYLPYGSHTFDRVFCTSVLSHVLHPEQVLCEAFRVLKPGGRLVVSVTQENMIENGIWLAKRFGFDRLFLRNMNPSGSDLLFKAHYHIQHFDLQRLLQVTRDLPAPIQISRIPSRLCPIHLVAGWQK